MEYRVMDGREDTDLRPMEVVLVARDGLWFGGTCTYGWREASDDLVERESREGSKDKTPPSTQQRRAKKPTLPGPRWSGSIALFSKRPIAEEMEVVPA